MPSDKHMQLYGSIGQHILAYAWMHHGSVCLRMLAYANICLHYASLCQYMQAFVTYSWICQHVVAYAGSQHLLACGRVCNRMLTYADYASICYHTQFMLGYASDWHRMLACVSMCYGCICWQGVAHAKTCICLMRGPCAVHARAARQTMPAYACICWHVLESVCTLWHLLAYASIARGSICLHTLGYSSMCYGSICQQMLAYANICLHAIEYATIC